LSQQNSTVAPISSNGTTAGGTNGAEFVAPSLIMAVVCAVAHLFH